ncbi:MAG: iron ABC transporter permease [Chloroflexi bacterium]|nr:iron ABC transporter permease [Chloroflexota bacterium]
MATVWQTFRFGVSSRKISVGRLMVIALLLMLAFQVLYPLGMVFFGSIRDQAPGLPGNFSLAGYIEVFSDTQTYVLFLRTLVLAIVRTGLTAAVAIFLAWAVTRTNIPMRKFFQSMIMFSFFMPLLPKILAWILLLTEKTGLMNQFLRTILPLGDTGPFNIYSYGGVIWVSVLAWTPILFILLVPAFKAMDANLEEQSRMSGGSLLSTIWHINIPLMRPALLAAAVLGFVKMMESFTIELLIGTPAKIFVLTTKIYNYVSYTDPPAYPPAMALAVALLVMTILIIVVQWKILGHREYTTVTGKGFRVTPVRLGKARFLVTALVSSYVFFDFVLPVGILLWGSFMKTAGIFVDNMYTLMHYQRAFNHSFFLRSIGNTIILAGASATIAMITCSVISYVVVKTKVKERYAVDLIAWVPWAIPAIVMSLGFLWAYILLPLPFGITLYGSMALMILVFVTKGFPIGTRTMTSTIVQIGKELEESSRIHGASWTKTFVSIIMPLVSPGFMAGWLLLFTSAVKDLETVILLYNVKTTVFSTVIYDWWTHGSIEEAFILGLLQAALIAVAFIAANIFARRALPSGLND